MIEITAEYLASQGLSLSFPKRFWKKVNKDGPIPPHRPELGPCWIWTASLDSRGYGHICRGGGGGPLILSHRASWILNRGAIPIDRPCVLHHCDNRTCNNPEHLFVGTKQDNADDMVAKGRYVKGKVFIGEDNPTNKISEEAAREIFRRSFLTEQSQKEIAKCFHVSPSLVSNIHRRKIWKCIHGPQMIPE